MADKVMWFLEKSYVCPTWILAQSTSFSRSPNRTTSWYTYLLTYTKWPQKPPLVFPSHTHEDEHAW